jgi:hypothetical protein
VRHLARRTGCNARPARQVYKLQRTAKAVARFENFVAPASRRPRPPGRRPYHFLRFAGVANRHEHRYNAESCFPDFDVTLGKSWPTREPVSAWTLQLTECESYVNLRSTHANCSKAPHRPDFP